MKVNDHLQTTNARIYAAGDICMKWKFTHAADAAARIVIQNALFLGRKKLSALTVPWCTCTDPEIAHVGLYERDADERGIEVDTYLREFKDVDQFMATLKGLLAYKLRLALTAIAVVLGVSFVVGTYVLSDTITGFFDKTFAEANQKSAAAP